MSQTVTPTTRRTVNEVLKPPKVLAQFVLKNKTTSFLLVRPPVAPIAGHLGKPHSCQTLIAPASSLCLTYRLASVPVLPFGLGCRVGSPSVDLYLGSLFSATQNVGGWMFPQVAFGTPQPPRIPTRKPREPPGDTEATQNSHLSSQRTPQVRSPQNPQHQFSENPPQVRSPYLP